MNPRKLKRTLLTLVLLGGVLSAAYYYFWGRYTYLVTAYCNCPICINVKAFHDGRFANGKKIYWGGIAADPKIPFGTNIELVPVMPQDLFAVSKILKGRKQFQVTDRGGKIKARHVDLFIPKSMGGHPAAKRWGARRMRLRINGKLAE